MSQYLDILNMVANQMGGDDGAVVNNQRRRIVNTSRNEYYGNRRWSFCMKPGVSITLTVDSNTVTATGTFPSDRNRNWDPENIYFYTGTTQYKFTKVPFDTIQSYPTSSYVYGLNEPAGTITTNQPAALSILADYFYVPIDAPLDGSGDTVVEPTPSITAVSFLAIAQYWLSAERDEANFDRFYKLYQETLAQDMRDDSSQGAIRSLRALPRQLGYNRRSGQYLRKGYISGTY